MDTNWKIVFYTWLVLKLYFTPSFYLTNALDVRVDRSTNIFLCRFQIIKVFIPICLD